jgi:hypothetical protein
MTIRQRQGERVYRCAVCGREEISDERRLKGALEQARQGFVRVFSLKPPECDIAFMETDAQDLALTGESEWEVIPAVMPQDEADVHRPAALLKMKGAPEVPEASVAWAQEVLHRLVGNQQSVAAGEGFVREKRSFRVLVPMRTPYRFACQLIVQQLVYAWVIDHVNLPGLERWVRAQLPWRKRHLATTLATRLLSERLPRADGSSPAPKPAARPISPAEPVAPLNPSAQQTPQEPDDAEKVKVAFEARLNPEKPFIEAMAERWPQKSVSA